LLPDISYYIRSLEQGLLNALHHLGLKSIQLIPGFTGIWVKCIGKNKSIKLKKVVAIGVGIKDGVSKHGFAININIDEKPYVKHIVPCGLKNHGVISLKELFCLESLPIPNYSVIVETVSECLAEIFSLKLKRHSCSYKL
jgi:lipoyl(octanoyl) transferase